MTITSVQRWIMSSLVLVTVEHLAAAIVLAAVLTDSSRAGNRMGLLVVATGLSVGGVVGFRVIHQKDPISLWLLAGAVPAVIGGWFCFGPRV